MDQEFQEKFEKWEENSGVKGFFNNTNGDVLVVPDKATVKAKFTELLKKCGKLDKHTERLVEGGRVYIKIENDMIKKIEVAYYDSLTLDFDGFGYKPEHGEYKNFVPYMFLRGEE